MKYLLPLFLMFITCLTVLVGCQSPPKIATIPAKVERVLSGQTIEVTLLHQQPPVRQQVRLQGIDAPDRQQAPWGKNSFEQLTSLIEKNNPQRLVQLELQEQNFDVPTQSLGDKSNIQPESQRLVASVWQNQVFLNLELVQEGYALAQLPKETEDSILNKHQTELLRAQDRARVLGIGIWDPAQPLRLTPIEFRRSQPSSQPSSQTTPQKVIPKIPKKVPQK